MRLLVPSLLAVAACGLAACAAQLAAAPAPAPVAASSILQSSDPGSGATVAAPLNALKLNFSPPTRLDEVLVAGSEGNMPMMITAAGEQMHYSLPLSALGPGVYAVSWRATAGGREYRGSFAFTVK